MIRLFKPRDILLVRDLQTRSIPLDLERVLFCHRTPLTNALLGFFSPKPANTLTCILKTSPEEGGLRGLAQVERRRDRLEGDIICLASSPEENQAAPLLWESLLEHLCIWGAEGGILRLFAKLPRDDGQDMEAFQEAGFCTYTQEHILRLDQLPAHLPSPHEVPLRPQTAGDAWMLQRLYSSVTPHLVQQAEGLAKEDWALNHRWGGPRPRGYILEEKGEVLGCIRFTLGRGCHWLRMLLDHSARERAEELARWSLALLAAHRPAPIYCCVRIYEEDLRTSLERNGFQYQMAQYLLVKHLAIPVRESRLKLLPNLEKRPEVVTTISRAKGGFEEEVYSVGP